MLSILKMVTAKNATKLIGILHKSISMYYRFNMFTTDLYDFNVIGTDKLAKNKLLFIRDLKIHNGCQSWLLIVAAKIASWSHINHCETISTVIYSTKLMSCNSWLDFIRNDTFSY